MGINYQQYVIIGISVDLEDLKVIDKPAVYESQNRYNPKTGAVSHTEQVLVSEEESHIEFMGKSYEDYYDIAKYFRGLTQYIDHDEKIMYLGFEPFETTDYGRADLINSELDILEFQEFVNNAQKIFPDHLIKMYFIAEVG